MSRINAALARLPAFSVAAILVGASATIGGVYGFRLGTTYSPIIGYVFAAASVAGAFAGSLAVANGLSAVRSREMGRAVACFALALVCVTYNSVAALSLSATVRGDLAASRAQVAERQDLARSARQRALAELEALPRNGKHAQRRRQLQAEIAAHDKTLAAQTVAVGSADPAAAAIGLYLKAATGNDFSASSIGVWLSLLPVAFLELGSSLALVALRRPTRANTVREHVAQPLNTGERQLVDALKQDGGTVATSQRRLAERLGISAAHVNKLLAGLKARGVVDLEADKAGTRAKLRAV